MTLRMEPGQIYNTWIDFKEALDAHCGENKVVFNISNAKTVEQANSMLKKKPYFDIQLKYASIIYVCKHYGSYKSLSSGLRPKQRSYKINCKAYISVSACRKENYLIIRDSCHIHTHPCTEEIYNSYPEVRRMTKEERKMVGTLMEMGVPTSQIKNAIGRHVTQKDLQNAKTHIKAVKMGIKNEEPIPGQKRKKTFKDIQEDKTKAGEMLTESDEDGKLHNSFSLPSNHSDHTSGSTHDSEITISQLGETTVKETVGYTVTVGDMNSLEDTKDTLEMTEATDNPERDPGRLAAGLNSGILNVNSQGHSENSMEVKDSYTITVSLPESDVPQTGTNLQEFIKGLPLEKVVPPKPSVPSHSPVRIKMEELSSPEMKSCSKCGGYISPLDGHDQCLSCLGPDHIHEVNCGHCLAMSHEQFNIRRKKMVALRMKALKEVCRKRKHELDQHDSDADYSPSIRKSKRPRKPTNFGPDMYVEDGYIFNNTNDVKNIKGNKPTKSNPLTPSFVPKIEPMEENESNFSYDGFDVEGTSHNSQRFDHVLSQAKVFEDVILTESDRGSLRFTPDSSVFREFQRSSSVPDIPPVPPTVMGKYFLSSQFESTFCSDPTPLAGVSENAVDLMGKGLVKLAKNATAQTRIAIYDKLFTRVGVGMADEALSILSDLCSKVTDVTEISQEVLTSDLQQALDTIQALKDVLEELGVMSRDAISTACYQRNISLSTLNAARKSLVPLRIPGDDNTQRRSKFLPFARVKANPTHSSNHLISPGDQSLYNGTNTASAVSPTLRLKELVVQADTNIPGLPLVTLATSQDSMDINTEMPTTFIMAGKEFTVGSLNNELLQSIGSSKDGIIELRVIKNVEDIMAAEETSVEEIIQAE